MIKQYKLESFVESGSYLGNTVNYFVKKKIKKIYSIELSTDLAEFCKKRFKKYNNVEILQGDSGELIETLCKQKIDKQTLFFLDGHYSGGFTAKGITECPLIKEIIGISKSEIKNHIIAIDDYNLIGNHADYPTLERLNQMILNINKDYKNQVITDILIFYI